MQKNMGSIDRTIRMIIGVIMILAGFYYQSWLGLVGLIPIATSVVGYCPAYAPFKFSTIKKK